MSERRDEDDFSERLAEFDEALANHRPGNVPDDASVLDESAADDDWQQAVECLKLLDRVRRQWQLAEADRGEDRLGGLADAACEPEEQPSSTSCFAADDLSSETPHVPRPAPLAAQQQVRFGKFAVERLVGQGGLGMVYLAVDGALGRRVALKIPRADTLASEAARRRFLREAEAASRLDHPNVVTVYESGDDDGLGYIASAFVDGPNLANWLQSHQGAIPVRTAALLVALLAEALHHAHARGVLHRDVKPSNVLLDPVEAQAAIPAGCTVVLDGEAYVPKLADFGLAKLSIASGNETRSGALLGTFAYMSPEQARGESRSLDARVDVYALGVLLYELLTGENPFQGASDIETLQRVLTADPKPVNRLRKDIPRDLAAITLRCLEKNRGQRYPTAQHLAEDLHRFLEGQPTEARPPGVVGTAAKWARRRPTAAALLGVVTLSVVVLWGVTVSYNVQLRKESTRAELARAAAAADAAANRQLLYSADVRLAYGALRANNIVHALDLLERHRPKDGQQDLREFAWHYVYNRCRPATRAFTGHAGDIFCVAWSPDGRQLATCSKDGTACLWEAATGTRLHLLAGHTSEVTHVVYAPDGLLVATASEDGSVRLWDVVSGAHRATLEGHDNHVLSLAFSPDGLQLASGDRDGRVCLWEVSSGELVRQEEGLDIVRALAYMPDGAQLIAVDEAGTLTVWQVDPWRTLARKWHEAEKFFTLSISPDGRSVAAGGRRRSVFRWQWTGQGLSHGGHLHQTHTEWVQALQFSPVDPNLLVSAGKDGVLHLWRHGQSRAVRTLLGHESRIWSVAWSPDGKSLASADAHGAVRIWPGELDVQDAFPTIAHAIHEVSFTSDGRRLITGDSSGRILHWDRYGRTPVQQFVTTLKRIRNAVVAPDQSLVVCQNGEAPNEIRRLETGELVYLHDIGDAIHSPAAWTPDSRRVALPIDKTTLGLFDPYTGQVHATFSAQATLRSAKFVRDDKLLVTSDDGLQLWDVPSQRVEYRMRGFCDVPAMDPGADVIALSASSNTLLVDWRTAKVLFTLSHPLRTENLDVDRPTLAVAIYDPPQVDLWDMRTGQPLFRLELPDARFVYDVAFSPDGQMLVAGGEDQSGRGRIWHWTLR